mgnify:CR=1 FL=1
MANQKKKLQLESISQLLANTAHFALIKYGNTSHQALESLRRELKKGDAKLRVIKRSLFEKAINKLSQQEKGLKEIAKKTFPLKEDSAILTLGEDYLKGLNIFANAFKGEKSLAFKFGFLDKKVYPAEELDKIAKLPGRDQLIATFIGSLKSSPAKMVFALKYNVSKLTHVLKERSKQS